MEVEDVCEDYRSSLADLTCNSKPLINMLTMLAEDNAQNAHKIVQVIETHLQKVSPETKLPVMYLIDSIIKNVGGAYLQLFTQNIVSDFCSVFEKVEEKTRIQLFKLRQTWGELFPAKKMYAIDVRVRSIDPAWPITAPKPSQSTIHLNPKFLDSKQQPSTGQAAMAKTPAPVVPAISSKIPPVTDQQAEVQQQVYAKQQELLRLQQQRLELELLQAKVKLEEQTRQLQLKSQQQHQSKFPQPNLQPAVVDPRLLRRRREEAARVRDPRIQKLLPPSVAHKIPSNQEPLFSIPLPSQTPDPPNSAPSLLKTPLTRPPLVTQQPPASMPSKIVVPPARVSPISTPNTTPTKSGSLVTSSPSGNSKNGKGDKNTRSPERLRPNSKSPVRPAKSLSLSGSNSSKKELNNEKPVVIDLTNDDGSDKQLDLDKNKKISPKKDIKKEFPKKNTAKDNRKKMSSSPDDKNKKGGRDDKKFSSSSRTSNKNNSRSLTRSRSRSRSPAFRRSSNKNKKTDKQSKNSPKNKNKMKNSDVLATPGSSESVTNAANEKSSEKKDGSSVLTTTSTGDVDLRSMQKSKEDKLQDVDHRMDVGMSEEQAEMDQDGKENNRIGEPPAAKKAKMEEIDSLFGGKDQDYRVPPTTSSSQASTSSVENNNKEPASPTESVSSQSASAADEAQRIKQKNWAQYKADHPDEYKSPLRPGRLSGDGTPTPSGDYYDDSPVRDKDFRFNRTGRMSIESREKGFDRLGRPLLSRRKQEQHNRFSKAHQPWQTPEDIYLSQITLMLERQDEILREAENHLQSGLMSQQGFQNVIAKFQGLKEQKMRLTLARDQELLSKQPGLCLPASKPIFLDGKMRKIKFFGRRAIVLMENNEPHEVSFSGCATSVFLDDLELFRLNFGGVCQDFVVEGSRHTIMFGAPSREIYVDGVPYQASFGGAAVPVHLDGKIHFLRLDGPQPSVELSEEVVRGLPDMQSEDEDDGNEGTRSGNGPNKENGGWGVDRDERQLDKDFRPILEDSSVNQGQPVSQSQSGGSNQGDVDMRIAPPVAGPVERLLGNQPPGSPNSRSNSPDPNSFRRGTGGNNSNSAWENQNPTGPEQRNFRGGNKAWNSPRRENNNAWNSPDRLDWQPPGGPSNNNSNVGGEPRRTLLEPAPGLRPNFQNYHNVMKGDDNVNVPPWNGPNNPPPDWDWRLGAPNRAGGPFQQQPPDGGFGDNNFPPNVGPVPSSMSVGGPPLLGVHPFQNNSNNHRPLLAGPSGPQSFRNPRMMMGGPPNLLRGHNNFNMRHNRPPPPMGGFPPMDGGVPPQNFFNQPPPQRFGLLGNQPRLPPPRMGMQGQPGLAMQQQQQFNENQFSLEAANQRINNNNANVGPPVPSVQIPSGADPLDIGSLLAKLVSSGLIQTETQKNNSTTAGSTSVSSSKANNSTASKPSGGIPGIDDKDPEEEEQKIEAIPNIELASDSLKGRYPGVIGVLYRGVQCASCGMRFKESHQDKYSQHLDWHFRANRREKDGAKKAFSRKWFYDVEDWIQFEEIEDLEDRARSFFDMQADEEQFQSDPVPVEIPSVPASQDQAENVCVVCSEPFQLFWVEEEEEWHLRGAVRKEGKSYHPLCYEDFVKAAAEAAAAEAAAIAAAEAAAKAAELAAAEKENEIKTENTDEIESKDESKKTEETEQEVNPLENAKDESEMGEAQEQSEKDDGLPKDNLDEPKDGLSEEPKIDEEMKEAQDEKMEEAQDEKAAQDDKIDEDKIEIDKNNDDDKIEEDKKIDENVNPALQEEIIGVISESEAQSEDETPKPESKMVVLQPAGLGKIVMKVKEQSIIAGPSSGGAARAGTPTAGLDGEGGGSEAVGADGKTMSTEDEDALDDNDGWIPPPPPDPRFKVLEPTFRGKELSGLCSIM